MQVMDGLFDDLRVLEKEQQLELQELENEPMELENDASSSNAVPAATQSHALSRLPRSPRRPECRAMKTMATAATTTAATTTAVLVLPARLALASIRFLRA